MNGKVILAAVLGFISGAAIGSIITYGICYTKIEAEQIDRTNKEIETAINDSKEFINKCRMERTGTTEPTDSTNDIHAERPSYNHIYHSNTPPKRESVVTEEKVPIKHSDPLFMRDYDELCAVTPKGDKNVFEWTFYENFRGGLMIDRVTDQVVNYNAILQLGAKELKNALVQSSTNELYIYVPDDGIGVLIAVDPTVSPELLEYDIPPTLYPSPSDDEEDDYEEDYEDDPNWG